jgi:hypothetical protein
MISVIEGYPPVFAALLNTYRPTVEVNKVRLTFSMVNFNVSLLIYMLLKVKSSGFSALIYAVQSAPPGIVQALLRRGADPNQGDKGVNTQRTCRNPITDDSSEEHLFVSRSRFTRRCTGKHSPTLRLHARED